MSTKQERFEWIDSAVAKALADGAAVPARRSFSEGGFRTITDADWAVALREARRCRNVVRDQIRSAFAKASADGARRPEILDLKLGKSESGNVGKNFMESL